MDDLREFIENAPLFDTHEHQPGFNQPWTEKNYEEFIDNDYATADINTAGGKFKKGDSAQNFLKWHFIRTTGYGQAANLATKRLFNLPFLEENAVKTSVAYARKLDFEDVSFNAADKAFSAIRQGRDTNPKSLLLEQIPLLLL